MHFICLNEELAELQMSEFLSQKGTNFVQSISFCLYSIKCNDDTTTEAYSLHFHCYIYSSLGKNSIFVQ